MAYLVARCPMLGCNHRNVVCDLHSESMPAFLPGVYIAVKCAGCGEIFREPVTLLEISQLACDGASCRDTLAPAEVAAQNRR